jgi:GNAT superfamily N-acetyltransferase
MAIVRNWRPQPRIEGPFRARAEDISALNTVFSDAFTERYRRDGMVGVRVPNLNPKVWRYAIDDADEGAMVWRDGGPRGDIVAFNMVHHSDAEGWMGPLVVRTDLQGHGAGKEVVERGIAWLRERGARIIGLETMPRTMDNIGFYSGLGFVPGKLTITLTLDAKGAEEPVELLGRTSAQEREEEMSAVRALVARVAPGYDFTREIELTDSLGLGDTLLLRQKGELVGFALCHTAPLVEGRSRDELRVLKLVLVHEELLDAALSGLRDFAKRSGTRRVALRVQGEYAAIYQRMIGMGARVRWTDLRMALAGFQEERPAEGVLLSNWEI